jgi:sulfur dioxygenase
MNKAQNFSCEQLYNVWSTDPDLIQIFDLRPKSEFDTSHIPGAQFMSIDKVTAALRVIGQKLAVFVDPENKLNEIDEEINHFDNYVVVRSCERWEKIGLPTTGNVKKYGEVAMSSDIIFQQLFESESSTYTYLIADPKTKEAAIIDPVIETVDRDIKIVEEMGLKLVYALDTHIHADHITGAGELRKRLGVKTAVSLEAGVGCADILLEDGQELLLGDKKIKVISTPGHTNTCLTYHFEGRVFTGDALLIRTCGRTDFQEGSPDRLYSSIHEKLFKLPEETVVYPGHDYRGHTSSTIGLEKKFNSRLKESISLPEFRKIMSELKLANPKKIHEAVPANLACGKPMDKKNFHPQIVDGIPEITPEDVYRHIDKAEKGEILLIDVRRPEEFNNELGHIKGAQLVTLGDELVTFLTKADKEKELVFICRSGARSGTATVESQKMGFKKTMNMIGGMIRWNETKLPIVKDGQ